MNIILSLDLLKLILVHYLSQRQMVTAKRTCKLWYSIIKEEVENMIPMLNIKYMIRCALHIYLGVHKELRNYANLKGNEIKSRRIWFKWACESGDEDLIIRWIRPNIRRCKYANKGLYYSGKQVLLDKLKIRYDKKYALCGLAKRGDLLNFQALNTTYSYNVNRLCILKAAKYGHIPLLIYMMNLNRDIVVRACAYYCQMDALVAIKEKYNLILKHVSSFTILGNGQHEYFIAKMDSCLGSFGITNLTESEITVMEELLY